MSKANRIILEHLAKVAGWVSPSHIPNGRGYTHPRPARGDRLSELKKLGLIEYGKEPQHSFYGYRITVAGRRALCPGQHGEQCCGNVAACAAAMAQ